MDAGAKSNTNWILLCLLSFYQYYIVQPKQKLKAVELNCMREWKLQAVGSNWKHCVITTISIAMRVYQALGFPTYFEVLFQAMPGITFVSVEFSNTLLI